MKESAMKSLFLALTVAACALMGCNMEPESVTLDLGTGVLQNAFIDGDLGDVVVAGQATVSIDEVPEDGLTSLSLQREEEVGTGLIILRTSNRTLEDFGPGIYLFNNMDTLLEDDELYVQLCSGPNNSTMSFESPSTAVAMVVEEIAGGLHYELASVGENAETGARYTGNASFDIMAE
jgi:hypothetical protein